MATVINTATFTEKLRAVRTHEDMKALVQEMSESGAGFYLYGKRRGYHAYSFTPYPPNPAKCHYLYDDGVSTGLCRWENLWKVLAVRS